MSVQEIRNFLYTYLKGLEKKGVKGVFLSEEAKECFERICLGNKMKMEVSSSIEEIRKEVERWAMGNKPASLREKMVFSAGNQKADLMLVGEAPGYDEERLGEPFVGKAGEKLNAILQAMGIQRSEVYLSNIVKFRPATEDQAKNNRQPTPEEMISFIPFLEKEIQVIKPRCIVALGKSAAFGLLQTEESIASLREQDLFRQEIPVFVTYHPSYLLRNSALSEKRKVWEDMMKVMRCLKMPISEKQGKFFLPS